MSFLFLSGALGSLSVMFPVAFSLFIDKIVVAYTIIAVGVIILFIKEKRKVKVDDKKSYVFKKKSGELTFEQCKERIQGAWEKESRKDFRQFLLWTGEVTTGIDWAVGAKLDADPMTMFIKYKDSSDKKEVVMWSEGFPNPGPGQYLTLGEDFKYFESDNGKIQDKGREKAYWDEANKALVRVRESNRTKIEVTQIRQVIDEDTLLLTLKAKKMDNHDTKNKDPTNECSMTFKFKSATVPEPPPYVVKGAGV